MLTLQTFNIYFIFLISLAIFNNNRQLHYNMLVCFAFLNIFLPKNLHGWRSSFSSLMLTKCDLKSQKSTQHEGRHHQMQATSNMSVTFFRPVILLNRKTLDKHSQKKKDSFLFQYLSVCILALCIFSFCFINLF